MSQASDAPYTLYNQVNSIEPHRCAIDVAPPRILAEVPVGFSRPAPSGQAPPPSVVSAQQCPKDASYAHEAAVCESTLVKALCIATIALLLLAVLVW